MPHTDDSTIPKPIVSVCIPVYRGANFISDAIESVLAQDFRDFELLIVDDCSGDGTGEIIERFAAKDPRIIYRANDSNLGMVANWNHCLKMARGRYVKFLFQDDIFIFPDSLGKMVRILDADPDVSLVASCRRVINRYSEVVKDEAFFQTSVTAKGFDIIRYCILKHGNVIGEPSAVIFRKEQACRGFNGNYRQIVDLEMWFHLLEQGKFEYIVEPLCGFRIHPGQQTRENIRNLVHLDDFTLLFNEYLSKRYVAIGCLDCTQIRFHQYYNLWKLAGRNIYDRNLALEKIKGYYGVAEFFSRLCFYKLYNPFFKFVRARFRRRILRARH